MSKAKYSTDNIGTDWHLIITLYSRYPDVMVHRLLQYYLDGGNQQMKKSMKLNVYILLQWKGATSAESSIKYMQVKYMQDHKDQEFLGVISCY
jgi:ribonuclease R